MVLDQEAKALVHRAVAEPAGVVHQQVVIPVLMAEIGRQAVGHVLDTAADGGVVEKIDHGSVDIGHRNPGSAAPDRLRAEQPAFLDVAQDELRAVSRLAPFAHRSRGHDQDLAKDLLGEVPVFRRAPPSDVRGVIERRNQDPGVIEHLLALKRLQLSGGVGARSDAPQPALTRPAREQLGRLRASDRERGNDVVDPGNILAPSHDGDELSPASWNGYLQRFHVQPPRNPRKREFSPFKCTVTAVPTKL